MLFWGEAQGAFLSTSFCAGPCLRTLDAFCCGFRNYLVAQRPLLDTTQLVIPSNESLDLVKFVAGSKLQRQSAGAAGAGVVHREVVPERFSSRVVKPDPPSMCRDAELQCAGTLWLLLSWFIRAI